MNRVGAERNETFRGCHEMWREDTNLMKINGSKNEELVCESS